MKKLTLVLFALFVAAPLACVAQTGIYGPGVSHTTSSPAGLTCAAGVQPIEWDPSGLFYTCQNGVLTAVGSGSGSGTVTSFSSGNLSPLFSTSVATATSTPAQTFTLSTAAQNAFFAGPSSGGTGTPSYRAIVAADVPTLNQSTTGNAATATNLSSYPTLCSGGQFSQGLSSGSNNCATPSGGGSGTVNSGTLGHLTYYAAAGTAVSSDSKLDDGTTTANTLTYTGSGGVAAPSFTSTGSSHGFKVPAGTALAGATGNVVYASDATVGYAEVNENNTGLARVCTAANASSVSGCQPTVVANTTITVAASVAFTANACSSVAGVSGTASTISMSGLATTMTATFTPNSDVHAITGWSPASGGQLYFTAWPSASGTLSYYVCNGTGTSITTGSSVTFNVSAR